jgi:hypothetical protein
MAAIALWPRQAHAGTITIETPFTGVNVGYFYSGFVSGTFDGLAHAVLGSVTMDNGAGLGAGLDAPATFEAYCVDIFGSVFDPGTSTQIVPVTVTAAPASMTTWTDPSGAASRTNAGAIAAYLYNTVEPTVTTDTQRTALAMAIWNVLYDNDQSVSNNAGSFYVWDDPGGVVTQANAYLATLGLSDATWLQLSTGSGSTFTDVQDFMGPLPTTTSVPEPSSAWLLLAGVFAIVVARRPSLRFLR